MTCIATPVIRSPDKRAARIRGGRDSERFGWFKARPGCALCAYPGYTDPLALNRFALATTLRNQLPATSP